jgi:hypothetical protein
MIALRVVRIVLSIGGNLHLPRDLWRARLDLLAGPAIPLLVTQMREKGSGFRGNKIELAEMEMDMMKVVVF